MWDYLTFHNIECDDVNKVIENCSRFKTQMPRVKRTETYSVYKNCGHVIGKYAT